MGVSASTRRITVVNDTDSYPGFDEYDTLEYRQAAKDVKEANDYWEGRIQRQQENHARMNQVYMAEYFLSYNLADQLFPRVPKKGAKVPGAKEKLAVIKCYKKNKKTPLQCAEVVREFACFMSNLRAKLQEEGNLS